MQSAICSTPTEEPWGAILGSLSASVLQLSHFLVMVFVDHLLSFPISCGQYIIGCDVYAPLPLRWWRLSFEDPLLLPLSGAIMTTGTCRSGVSLAPPSHQSRSSRQPSPVNTRPYSFFICLMVNSNCDGSFSVNMLSTASRSHIVLCTILHCPSCQAVTI